MALPQKTEVSTRQQEVQEEISIFDHLESAFADFDDKDVGILVKFYLTGRSFPFDTQPYCFPILVKELNDMGFKIGREAVRKRMKMLVELNLLTRDCIGKNITSYNPLRDNSAIDLIRKYIQRWCSKRGLNQVFKISDNNK